MHAPINNREKTVNRAETMYMVLLFRDWEIFDRDNEANSLTKAV